MCTAVALRYTARCSVVPKARNVWQTRGEHTLANPPSTRRLRKYRSCMAPDPSSNFDYNNSIFTTADRPRYATATDEFEIATEETEKQTVYAADDRTAAQEELAKLNKVFEEAVKGNGGEEIKRRVGGRIRELDRAVEALLERANEQGG